MLQDRRNTFEIILLIVGVVVSLLGFNLINTVYKSENTFSWMMIISIFSWLTLLVMLILLSLMVDASKRELNEMEKINESLKKAFKK